MKHRSQLDWIPLLTWVWCLVLDWTADILTTKIGIKRRSVKTRKHYKTNQCKSVISEDQQDEAQQGKPMPECHPLSVGLYLYPFQTSHVLSHICSGKASHALLPGSFQKNIIRKKGRKDFKENSK